MIKGQDIVILIALLFQKEKWTIAKIGDLLELSDSQVHAALKRTSQAGLYSERTRQPIISPLEEFLIHSVKYHFPGELGKPNRGLPTSHSAPPLNSLFDSEEIIVWPDGSSTQRGTTLTPIHKSAIPAAKHNSKIYEVLVLVDAIRIGRARERSAAIEILSKILKKNT